MNKYNLFTTTDDPVTDKLNIIKSWLCGCSDGETYPILQKVADIDFKRVDLEHFDGSTFSMEEQLNDIIGYDYNHSIDDPELDGIAKRMLDEIDALMEDIYAHPEKYMDRKQPRVYCNAHDGISCDYAVRSADMCRDCCTRMGECPFKRNF